MKHKTEKYLVPMSDVHNDDIKNLLDKHNIQHTEVVMYRTVSNDLARMKNLTMICWYSLVRPVFLR